MLIVQESMVTVFNAIDIFSYALCVFSFSVLLGIHYSIRDEDTRFIPFYIALIFIGYILCDAGVVAYSITFLFSEDGHNELLNNAIEVTYSYLLPLVLFSTIERLAATCLVKKYENMRPWGFFAASQIVCLSLIGCCYIFYNGLIFLPAKNNYNLEYFGGSFSSYMIIACEICIYIVVTVLLLINKRRTRLCESYNFSKLSLRYQLVENIRLEKGTRVDL
ncbi:hypothetical protein PRIPAC_95985 [Pristionchus pacificus]|uniref:G protein-coupled receptor n=1 Tax=Pristionchus pacificus TaxID=54126 RepID=A0A2A6D3F4_PRIPA|nr:hypothetical protein PRIPAC_95985 [Pristionchus pacificus]|eukprot:PDM84803.1 G protein-coupled receptor [Pristionchus pacificus]